MLLDLGGVARLPAPEEHIAHCIVRGAEEAAGFGVRRGGIVPARGEGVGLLGIGERGDDGAVGEVLDALAEEEPREGAERGGPGGVEGEQLAVGGAGGDGLAAAGFQPGGAEQRPEFGASLILFSLLALAHALEDPAFLLGDVGEGHVHAFLFEDACHFLEDRGGVGAAFEFGEALREFINARDAGLVRSKGGFAELLALGGLGSFGFGKVAVALLLGADEDLFADTGGGDLRAFDDLLLPRDDFPRVPFHPQHPAADGPEQEDDEGQHAEDAFARAAHLLPHLLLLLPDGEDLLLQGEDAGLEFVLAAGLFPQMRVVEQELPVLVLERAEFVALDIPFGIEREGLRADEGIDSEAGLPALLLKLAADGILHLRVAAARGAGRERGGIRLRAVAHPGDVDHGLAVGDLHA